MDSESAAFKKVLAFDRDSIHVRIPVSLGISAITVFHDVNSNEVLDTSLFGFPKEPYGFSNNARGMFGPPEYEACKIMNTTSVQLKINLE